jgi:hypothetical protein
MVGFPLDVTRLKLPGFYEEHWVYTKTGMALITEASVATTGANIYYWQRHQNAKPRPWVR